MHNLVKTNLSIHENQDFNSEAHPMEGKIEFSEDQPQRRQFLPHFQPVLLPGDGESDKKPYKFLHSIVKTNISTHKNTDIKTQTYAVEGKTGFLRDQPQNSQFSARFQPMFSPFLPQEV